MIECPSCYRVFRTHPENLGARCPKCRMPLFESPLKKRQSDKEHGACATHPENPALIGCKRCSKPMCAVCRTRWHQEAMCPACVDASLVSDEPNPHERNHQFRLGLLSICCAMAGWILLALTLFPYSTFRSGPPNEHWVRAAGFCIFISLVPAVASLGQAVSALRLRGACPSLATWGLALSGSQIGVMLGVLFLNLWHN